MFQSCYVCVTNWKELGGEDLPIRVFRLEDITQYYTEEELGPAYEYAGDKITELVEKTPGIVAFVPQKFIVHPDTVHFIEDNTISVKDVFAGAEWFPTATPAAQFGFLPLITGTVAHRVFRHRYNSRQCHNSQYDTSRQATLSHRKIKQFLNQRNNDNQSEKAINNGRNTAQLSACDAGGESGIGRFAMADDI